MRSASAVVPVAALALFACVNREGVERAREQDVVLDSGETVVWSEVGGGTVKLSGACSRSSQQISFCVEGDWEVRWLTVSARGASEGTGVVAVSLLPFDTDPGWGDAGDLELGEPRQILQVFHWEKATVDDFAACAALNVEFDLVEGDAASVEWFIAAFSRSHESTEITEVRALGGAVCS